MVEILEQLHKQYVPIFGSTNDTKSVKIVEKVLFGGDQLTEERARNATDGRSDGDSEYERLEGLIPKVEDWHAKRILYQVLQCIISENIMFTQHVGFGGFQKHQGFRTCKILQLVVLGKQHSQSC